MKIYYRVFHKEWPPKHIWSLHILHIFLPLDIKNSLHILHIFYVKWQENMEYMQGIFHVKWQENMQDMQGSTMLRGAILYETPCKTFFCLFDCITIIFYWTSHVKHEELSPFISNCNILHKAIEISQKRIIIFLSMYIEKKYHLISGKFFDFFST